MSWTICGANRMAKTIQLCRNGKFSRLCHTIKCGIAWPRANSQPLTPQTRIQRDAGTCLKRRCPRW